MFSIAAWPAAPVAPETAMTAAVGAAGVTSPTIVTGTLAEPPMVDVTLTSAGGAGCRRPGRRRM